MPLQGRNHILLADEPAWDRFSSELYGFVRSAPQQDSHANDRLDSLTARERVVLSLVASGLSNQEIAEETYLSERTVERHLSNVYAKLGLSGKAARAGAAALFSKAGGVMLYASETATSSSRSKASCMPASMPDSMIASRVSLSGASTSTVSVVRPSDSSNVAVLSVPSPGSGTPS